MQAVPSLVYQYIIAIMYMSTSLRGQRVFVYAVSVFIAISLSIFTFANAAIFANVAVSLTVQGQTIKASSSPVAVIGLNLVSNSETLASTSIAFLGSNGFSTTTDLAALGNATSSGVALYRDDPSAGTQGTFDANDDVVPLQSATWNMATTTLDCDAGRGCHELCDY